MIREIAHKINDLSHDYQIGELQSIRKTLKGFSRVPGSSIFTDTTVSRDDDWAFHFGGRKELQFNIGLEDGGKSLRYGIAFSLETSRSMPDISVLFKGVKKLNQFVRENPSFFAGYKMWHYQRNTRSLAYSVTEIPENLLVNKTFIFIGKQAPIDDILYSSILNTFDELLTPYIYVEKEEGSGIIEYELKTADVFTFNTATRQLPQSREYTTERRAVDLEVRHSTIQEKLAIALIEQWGKEHVSIEQVVFGKKIDVVLKSGTEFDFYEIKTCGSAKACIREALGQLMEYAYWPSCENATNLIVVGEEAIDRKTVEYLRLLNNKFGIPIRYEQIPV